MIRNLPEGSRYGAATTVDRGNDDTPTEEPDPRTESLMDHRVWTIDRRLTAMAINAIYSQVAVSGHWGKAGPPDFPIIGPASWRDAGSKQSKEPKDNFDVLKRMGWPGG